MDRIVLTDKDIEHLNAELTKIPEAIHAHRKTLLAKSYGRTIAHGAWQYVESRMIDAVEQFALSVVTAMEQTIVAHSDHAAQIAELFRAADSLLAGHASAAAGDALVLAAVSTGAATLPEPRAVVASPDALAAVRTAAHSALKPLVTQHPEQAMAPSPDPVSTRVPDVHVDFSAAPTVADPAAHHGRIVDGAMAQPPTLQSARSPAVVGSIASDMPFPPSPGMSGHVQPANVADDVAVAGLTAGGAAAVAVGARTRSTRQRRGSLQADEAERSG